MPQLQGKKIIKGWMIWRVYSGISGTAVNVPAAAKPAMNSTIGIYAKENANAVEKRGRNSTIGAVVNVQDAGNDAMNSMTGRGANAVSAEKRETRGMIGTPASVLSAVRKIIIG